MIEFSFARKLLSWKFTSPSFAGSDRYLLFKLENKVIKNLPRWGDRWLAQTRFRGISKWLRIQSEVSIVLEQSLHWRNHPLANIYWAGHRLKGFLKCRDHQLRQRVLPQWAFVDKRKWQSKEISIWPKGTLSHNQWEVRIIDWVRIPENAGFAQDCGNQLSWIQV